MVVISSAHTVVHGDNGEISPSNDQLYLLSINQRNIYIGYYTGSRSVWLDIFTSLTYFVESAGRDKIQRRVKIYSSTELDYLCNKLFIIRQINQGKNEFSTIYSAAFNCRLTAR